jgi:hypothetical protein
MDNNVKANCTTLKNTYNFYYHNPDNQNWDVASYINLLEFNTLEEWWILDKFIRKDMVENGMFFIMLDKSAPVWECPTNINGGCISWKVDRKTSYKSWIDTVGHFIMQDFGNYTSKINGVSISPKKNASIIKLWYKESVDIDNMALPKSFILAEDKIIYKSHVQNIDKDKTKKNGYEGLKYEGITSKYEGTTSKYEGRKLYL